MASRLVRNAGLKLIKSANRFFDLLAEMYSEKVELIVRVVPSSIIILAVDNLRLLRMKLQLAFLQSCGNRRPNFLGFRLCPAMHDRIIGITLERQIWVMFPHPHVKRVMQEQIGQQWTGNASLRRAPFTRNNSSLLVLRWRF
jgi:hypothetical protein